MGVPKFYRWLSQRYPLINRKIGSDPRFLPHFDNFYLDLNGIIHGCSHPDDNEERLAKVLSFEEICANMEQLMDKMVQTVRPRRVLFIAVDGCAPRAKMNQQRSRRFASARDRARILESNRLKASASKVEDEEHFDSNVITPGTDFMAKLHIFLQAYIAKKIETDAVWRNLKVIYSGHSVPGEGEHKIMEYIRSERRKPTYDPNTRHCCNSLDADLIMLGLSTHEKRFCLLREEVDFTGGRDDKGSLKTKEYSTLTTDLEKWELLDLSILRQYLLLEFKSFHFQKMQKLGIEYDESNLLDTERVIDDMIVLISVIGNDFLPHIHGVEIKLGSLDRIFKYYKEMLYDTFPRFNYVVSDDGKLNLPNIFKIFQCLAEEEENHFKSSNKGRNKTSQAVDGFPTYKRKYYSEKFGVNWKTGENVEKINLACTSFMQGIVWCFDYYFYGVSSWSWYYPFHYAPLASDLSGYIRLADLSTLLPREETLDKSKLLDNLLNLKDDSGDDILLTPVKSKVISDDVLRLNKFNSDAEEKMSIVEQEQITEKLQTFSMDAPLKPFFQLMCCLPPQSSHALPGPFAKLMTEDSSPLHEFYPTTFVTDLNGKRHEYEGVNIIPFIDIKKIKDAVEQHIGESLDGCSDEEKQRNTFGDNYIFEMQKKASKCTKTTISFPHKVEGIVHGIGQGSKHSQNNEECVEEGMFQGDASIFSLFPNSEKSQLKDANLNIFGRPSKEESMMINVSLQKEIVAFAADFQKTLKMQKGNRGLQDHDGMNAKIAAMFLNNLVTKNNGGKVTCWVNFPYLLEAELHAVLDKDNRFAFQHFRNGSQFTIDKGYQSRASNNFGGANATFEFLTERLNESLQFGAKKVGTGGIEVDDFFLDIVVEVVPKTGIRFDFQRNKFCDVFSGQTIYLPIQLIAFENPGSDRSLDASYYNQLLKNQELLLSHNLAVNKEKFMVLTDDFNAFGYVGVIKDISSDDKLILSLTETMPDANLKRVELSFGRNLFKNFTEKYYSTGQVASIIGVSPSVIGKITGSVYVKPGRLDVGLNLKVGKKYKTPGYTQAGRSYASNAGLELWQDKTVQRDVNGLLDTLSAVEKTRKRNEKSAKSSNSREYTWQWQFSDRSVKVIKEYYDRFPTVFHCIENDVESFEYNLPDLFEQQNQYMYSEQSDVLEDNNNEVGENKMSTNQKLGLLKTFLGSIESMKAPLIPVESRSFSPDQIQAAKQYMQTLNNQRLQGFDSSPKEITVKRSAGITLTALKCQMWFDSPTSHLTIPQLGDRIANMGHHSFALGQKGIIIATHPITKCVEVLFDDFKTKVLKYTQVVNLTQPRYVSYSGSSNSGGSQAETNPWNDSSRRNRHVPSSVQKKQMNTKSFPKKQTKRHSRKESERAELKQKLENLKLKVQSTAPNVMKPALRQQQNQKKTENQTKELKSMLKIAPKHPSEKIKQASPDVPNKDNLANSTKKLAGLLNLNKNPQSTKKKPIQTQKPVASQQGAMKILKRPQPQRSPIAQQELLQAPKRSPGHASNEHAGRGSGPAPSNQQPNQGRMAPNPMSVPGGRQGMSRMQPPSTSPPKQTKKQPKSKQSSKVFEVKKQTPGKSKNLQDLLSKLQK